VRPEEIDGPSKRGICRCLVEVPYLDECVFSAEGDHQVGEYRLSSLIHLLYTQDRALPLVVDPIAIRDPQNRAFGRHGAVQEIQVHTFTPDCP
jgi:hypothetical protein